VTAEPGAFHYDAAREVWFTTRNVWVRAGNRRFVIPKGFECDLASIPWFLRWKLERFDLSLLAAFAHDWLYRTAGLGGRYTRLQADRVFLRLMKDEGVPKTRRRRAYKAVRMFGWKSMKKVA
jgi:hypothetical protein